MLVTRSHGIVVVIHLFSLVVRHKSDMAVGPSSQPQQLLVLLHPIWQRFTGWSDQKGKVSGIMDLSVDYDENKSLVNLETMIQLPEMVTGTSGRLSGMKFNYGASKLRVLKIFVGEYAQPIDGTCYPFDTQKLTFTFRFPPYLEKFFRIQLFCIYADSNCTAIDADGEVVEISDPFALTLGHTTLGKPVAKTVTKKSIQSSQGFNWGATTCETSGASATCTIYGKRLSGKMLNTWILPGGIMILVGFVSTMVPVSLRMPRVAVTMIAMLTFINKSTAALDATPIIGNSWITQFYTLGSLALFLNMLGHVAAFNHEHLHHFIAMLTLSSGLFLFLFTLSLLLHVKECKQVPSASSLSAVIVTAIMWIASSAHSLVLLRRGLRSGAIDIKDGIDGLMQDWVDLPYVTSEFSRYSDAFMQKVSDGGTALTAAVNNGRTSISATMDTIPGVQWRPHGQTSTGVPIDVCDTQIDEDRPSTRVAFDDGEPTTREDI